MIKICKLKIMLYLLSRHKFIPEQRPFVKQGQTWFDVVKICMVLKPDYQTFAMLFRILGEMKAEFIVLHQTLQHENVTVRSNEPSF